MELSPRLRAIADWVPANARFADIGTDHGYLPVWLLQKKIIPSAIAADLRERPLNTAVQTAKRYGVEEKVSFRLCDGLNGIHPGEVDTVSIAGMGGETIAGILAAAPWLQDRNTQLLLQPQSAFYDLRSFLYEHGYRVTREKIIREGRRLYTVLDVCAGQEDALSPGALWAGKNTNDPLRGDFLSWLIRVLSKAMEGMRRAAEGGGEEITRLEAAIEDLKAMKMEWDSWQP